MIDSSSAPAALVPSISDRPIRVVVLRSEDSVLWIEPNRNGLTSYVWSRRLNSSIARLVRQFYTKAEAQVVARQLGFLLSDVRQHETRFHRFWCVIGNEGGLLADESSVVNAQCDPLQDVIAGHSRFLPSPA